MVNRTFQDEIAASEALKKARLEEQRQKFRESPEAYKAIYVDHRVAQSSAPVQQVIKSYDEFINLNAPTRDDVDDTADFKYKFGNFQQRKDAFVPLWEEAFYKNNGEVPLDFFLQFDQSTLELFNQTIPEQETKELVSIWDAQARDLAYQRALDEEVERRIAQSNFAEATAQRGLAVGLFGIGGLLFRNANEAPDKELTAAEKNRLRARVEEEWSKEPDRVGDGFWSQANKAGSLLFGGYGVWNMLQGRTFTDTVGYTIDKAFSIAAPAFRAADFVAGDFAGASLPARIMDWRHTELEEQRRKDMDEIEASLGYADVFAQQSLWDDAERDFEELPEEEKQFLIDVAGGEVQAMGLFKSQRDSLPEVEEQYAQYVEEYTAQARDGLKILNETEFSDKESLLDGLAAWGNMTGDFAVGALLLMDSNDVFQDGFEGFFNEIKEADHSPAQLMGWDGTALGIGFDFGMMALFDPTTYMFGGGAASAAGRGTVRTQKAAMRWLDSAEAVNKYKEIGKMVMSPDTGHAALVTASGLDGPGLVQLMNVTELANPAFRRGKDLWRASHPNAGEALVEWIVDLLPEGVSGSKAAKAITKRGGYNKPINIEVGTSGTLKVADGDAAALAAAVENNWGVVPVQLNYVDDGFKAYNPTQIKQMEDTLSSLPEANLSSALNSEGAQGGLLDDFQASARDSDRVLGTIEKGGRTYQVRKTSNFTTDPVDGGGEWAAFRRAGRESRGELRDFKHLWYVVDDNGRVVGGYNGYGIVRAGDDNFKGIMHDALRVSEDAGDSFLPRLMERATAENPDFSRAGRGFLERALKDRLNSRIGTTKMDDLWGESAKLPDTLPSGPAKLGTLVDETALMGGSNLDEQIRNIYKGQMMRNGRLEDMTYTAVARGMLGMVKKLSGMSDNGFVDYTKRFFTQRNLSRTFNTSSEFAVDDALDYMMRMFGDDTELLDDFTRQITDEVRGVGAKRRVGQKQTDRIKELEARHEALSERVGTVVDQMDDATRAELMADNVLAADRRADMSALHDLERELAAARGTAAKSRATLPDNRRIFEILDDAVDAYNKKYLATNKAWQGKHPTTGEDFIDPATGLVKRKFLRHGLNTADEGPRGASRNMGFADEFTELDKTLKKITTSDPQQYDLGVSALDLAVAREMGGAKYMKYTQAKTGDGLRKAGHGLHNAWIIDKVIRPATAAVVTVDEAMRILHLYGMDAFRMYLHDKAIFTEARVAAAFRGNNPLGRDAVSQGASALSAKAQERIRRLNDQSSRISSAERTFFDQQGIGWVDIGVDDPLYRTYAREWTQQFTEDTGFRAFLEGEEAFASWWDEAPEAAMLREKAVNMRKGGKPPTKDDIFEGWTTVWEVLSSEAKKAGVLDDWTNAWKTTTREVSAGGRNVPLPESVFDNFIPVRGAQKLQTGGVNRMTDAFFDRFFMDPVQYRRGFIAEMIRKTEGKRLRQFYESQGKTIVPDTMLEDVLQVSGYRTGHGIGLPEAQAHIWADSGYVPQSHVNTVIERTVAKEIENMLYVWNMGSRAGSQIKTVFPFGKPYADMMGFWGREMFKKPILRGYLNNDNYLNMSALTDKLPFNPKTGALLSRMAATDFHVDRGWIPEEGDTGEGLLPGSQSTDLSPIFFLPTQGDDILGSTLPGLGFIPLAFLDVVLDYTAPDPVEDPVGYNEMVQTISEGLPYFEFQQGGFASRVFGGGSISTLFSAAVDAQGYFGGETYFNITSEFGDIGREIRRAREVGVLLADPEVLADIAGITDPELLELYIDSLVSEANQKASGSHFLETVSRWTVPAKSRYDVTGAELQQVWLDAASAFPDVIGVEPQVSLETLEGKRQYAADIRNVFFDLEGWERDLLISAHPQLAVNMVSSWDWTPKAVNAGFDGTDRPYRSGGSPSDLLRHDYFVDNGFVRPIQPAQRARLILGQISEARDNSIKRVYESVVGDVNTIIWDAVQETPEVIAYFEDLQATYGAEMGTKDIRHIWENWSTVEDFILKRMELEGEVFDEENPRSLGLPDRFQSWSTQWTGYEGTTSRFGDLVDITLPPDAAKIATTLGLDYTEGMTGEQFHRMLADHLAENESLADGVYRTSWDQYTTERLAFSSSSDAQLNKAIWDPQNEPVWRNEFQSWVDRVDHIKEQFIASPQGIPNGLRQKIVDEFNGIVASSKDRGNVAWDTIWEGRYKNVFGQRDWTPLEPLSPLKEDGSHRETTRVPLVHSVVDGDTLIVSDPTDSHNKYAVRLLGVSAHEYGTDPDEAEQDSERLREALRQARENGDRLYLVTDPGRFVTNTDRYGRMLAWLWLGDKPFYFEDEMNPVFTPSGGNG